MISDPVVSKTLFAGTGLTVYRTKTAGLGARTFAEAQRDLQRVDRRPSPAPAATGSELGPTPLTDAAWGDRAGTAMAAIERTTADTSTGVGRHDDRTRVRLEERGRRSGVAR